MNDPYGVLGVDRNASDEQVKSAYRELAKKYHPDNYVDNPLSDLATEKMQEINDAYDAIMNERRSNGSGSTSSSGSKYPDVRNLITQNRLDEAIRILDQVNPSERTAEWYFLCGSVQYKRGRFDDAYTSFMTAHQMEPNNAEYRTAAEKISSRRGGFNPYNTRRVGSNCCDCDCCTSLICADCCCEAMGGDLIGCC